MAVITLASPKGGCGKSTAAIVLAGQFAEQGYRVRIIDADPKQRVARWAAAGTIPESISVITADAKTLVGIIRAAELENDVVLIDVEGSANMTVPLAIAHAHYVAIPANPSAADVEDAIETVALVNDIPNTSGRPPVHAVLWTRVPTGFRTREFTALAKQLDEAGIPVCPVVLSERSAYKSLISYGTTLDRLPKDEVPSLDKARDEGRALADVISAAIVSAQEKAA
jgi:chromosome partitioning protein